MSPIPNASRPNTYENRIRTIQSTPPPTSNPSTDPNSPLTHPCARIPAHQFASTGTFHVSSTQPNPSSSGGNKNNISFRIYPRTSAGEYSRSAASSPDAPAAFFSASRALSTSSNGPPSAKLV